MHATSQCHAVAGKFKAVADEFTLPAKQDIVFATVMMDKVKGFAQEVGVSKTPTFQVRHSDLDVRCSMENLNCASVVARAQCDHKLRD
jgi:hypothetical protein